jgi:hypothetical protein
MCSLIRIVPVLLLLPVLTASFIEAAPTQPGAPGGPTTVADRSDDGWSLDDVKDVFEAIQFVAITIGIGAAVYWLCFEHIPRMRIARIEFDVEVVCVGEMDSARLVEIVALVRNLGFATAEFADGRFMVSSVAPGAGASHGGLMLQPSALAPLVEGTWSTSKVVVDAGARMRLACAVAIARTITHVVVTGQITNPLRATAYTASRLVELQRRVSS